MNGKFNGRINNVILPSIDLHSYIVSDDGRTFTAISRINDTQLGFSMQSLYTITDILGWLFAVPTSTRVKNGFMITGLYETTQCPH